MADSIQDQFLAVEALAVRPARAAELLDMSRESIYNLMRAGELASFKIGGSRRIPVDSLREFIARRLARESAVQVDHRMTKAEELVVHEVTYRDDITDIDHPDARLIYEARNALPALLVVALAAQEAMPYLRMLGHLEDPAVQLANSRPLNEIMADLKAALDG